MDSAQTSIVGQLIDAVRAHYQSTKSPLYLSRFGQTNPDLRKSVLASFNSLGSAIRSAGPQYIEIVSPRHQTGGEIVVTPEVKDDILGKIDALFADYSAAAQAFDKLPLPIRVAFCVRVEDDQQVMVCLRPRFRFERIRRGAVVKKSFYLVDDKYRHPGINLHEATPADKLNLWRSFSAWREENNIDEDEFNNKSNTSAGKKLSAAAETGENALKRLIEAQHPDIQRRIIIPADIALLLLGAK